MRFFSFHSKKIVMNYSLQTTGKGFSKRIFLLNEKKEKISFWNDVPLQTKSNLYNSVIEIPFDHLAKLELCKFEKYHPIMQDVRKSKYTEGEMELRYYALFPLFNYGYFPQTWENSLIKHDSTEFYVQNY